MNKTDTVPSGGHYHLNNHTKQYIIAIVVISLKGKNRVAGECRQRGLIYTGCSEAASSRLGLKERIGIGQEDWESGGVRGWGGRMTGREGGFQTKRRCVWRPWARLHLALWAAWFTASQKSKEGSISCTWETTHTEVLSPLHSMTLWHPLIVVIPWFSIKALLRRVGQLTLRWSDSKCTLHLLHNINQIPQIPVHPGLSSILGLEEWEKFPVSAKSICSSKANGACSIQLTFRKLPLGVLGPALFDPVTCKAWEGAREGDCGEAGLSDSRFPVPPSRLWVLSRGTSPRSACLVGAPTVSVTKLSPRAPHSVWFFLFVFHKYLSNRQWMSIRKHPTYGTWFSGMLWKYQKRTR